MMQEMDDKHEVLVQHDNDLLVVMDKLAHHLWVLVDEVHDELVQMEI